MLFFSFTHTRLVNLIKLRVSYDFARWFHTSFFWGMPTAVSIEPTTRCNLHCLECPSGQGTFTRPTGTLSFERYKKMLHALSSHLTYLTLYFQGEPYLNKDFFDMVRYARAHRIYVSTSTNGHFLTEKNIAETLDSGLNRLIVSLDGADAETYNTYRKNGHFEQVIRGLQALCRAKKHHRKGKHLQIVLQFIVFGTNEHQIPIIKKLAKEIGVDKLELKTAQIYNYRKGSTLIPTKKKYSRYVKQSDGTYKLKKTIKNKCWRVWSSCVFTWDGRVVPCCFDKNADYEMGLFPLQSVRDIVHGKKFSNFRKKVFSQRKSIDICCNCSE